MPLSKVHHVQANIFQIRPINAKYECYGISIFKDEAIEQLLNWASNETILLVEVDKHGCLIFMEGE